MNFRIHFLQIVNETKLKHFMKQRSKLINQYLFDKDRD